MRVIWQSEIDPYASAVLRKHWPAVPNLGDVRGIEARTIRNAIIKHGGPPRAWRSNPTGSRECLTERSFPDVLCGGFPCQDISNAGKRAGIDGERSGLWGEFARIIGELRPRYVLIENVAALLGRGIERVLGDLAALGFDAEWHCIPASAVGAPHRRDRVWVVAYANGGGCVGERIKEHGNEQGASWSEPDGCSVRGWRQGADMAYRQQPRLEGHAGNGADGNEPGRLRENESGSIGACCLRGFGRLAGWWESEPDVGRVADGVPAELDGGLNAQEHDSQASAEGDANARVMSGVRRNGKDGEASSRLFTPGSFRDSVFALSRQSGLEGWHAQGEAAEAMQGLRQGLHAESQHQAQHMLAGVPVEDWANQRNEAMGPWGVEPAIPRVAHGVAKRVDRLRCLGNSIVPQIAEVIGRAIVEHERDA